MISRSQRLHWPLREQAHGKGLCITLSAEHTHKSHRELSHSTIPSPAARLLAKQAVSR
ncbi:hypothetical protein KPSA1_06507 [Pseudomonas syringae pv. actinidiae]|uniref:Uncharacterized protein n=1 Tax=Pseudomonas syringae pv. actinidiae TaxID=103796 RepID=A0A2V0QJP8_PSESF|nr:hypothetical protein KPSA1_06507 [Pseudomonas syringae pv. actinidiae]